MILTTFLNLLTKTWDDVWCLLKNEKRKKKRVFANILPKTCFCAPKSWKIAGDLQTYNIKAWTTIFPSWFNLWKFARFLNSEFEANLKDFWKVLCPRVPSWTLQKIFWWKNSWFMSFKQVYVLF